jgi:hypothetical protein
VAKKSTPTGDMETQLSKEGSKQEMEEPVQQIEEIPYTL